MNALRYVIFIAGAMLPLAVTANEVDEKSMGEAVERHLSIDAPFTQWVQDPDRIDHEASDTIEFREGLADGLETIKLTGLVRPIYFESGIAQIPEGTVESLGACRLSTATTWACHANARARSRSTCRQRSRCRRKACPTRGKATCSPLRPTRRWRDAH